MFYDSLSYLFTQEIQYSWSAYRVVFLLSVNKPKILDVMELPYFYQVKINKNKSA